MNAKETNFLAPILSALAGLGAIIAALSPLFTETRITKVFIDQNNSGFLAIIAFMVSVLNLWVFGSRTAGLAFTKTIDLQVLARRRIEILALFLISAAGFYSTRLVYGAHHLGFAWGSFIQTIFYFAGFFFLTALIGLQFRDTFEQYRWKTEEENRPFKIRDKLIDSGHVRVDLKIESIQTLIQKPGFPPNWQSAYYVVYETGGTQYVAFVDSNSGNILENHKKEEEQADEDISTSIISPPAE